MMSYWICCNSCFLPPTADRKLAVTTCGHIICSVCFQKHKQGKCLICNSNCQVSPISDKSSSEVKALFSDISVVATRHFTEVGKIIMFQARHKKRLLTHYKERDEKLEELLVKMKQEMQQMTKKLNEQSAYITKLENSIQHHQSVKAASVSQMNNTSHSTPHRHKSVLQIPYASPVSLSRHSSVTSVIENMDVDDRSLFRKPVSVPRLSFISPPQAGQMGTVPQRASSQSVQHSHSARSATVSHFQRAALTPEMPYSHSSGWKSPIFKPPSSFRHSTSCLVLPPS